MCLSMHHFDLGAQSHWCMCCSCACGSSSFLDMKNVPLRSVLVPAPFITDKVVDQHLDKNSQDASAQHTAANACPCSEVPFHIQVWRPPSGPPPPGSEEALEVWRQPQIIHTEDRIEVPAVWFNRWCHLQHQRTPPLLNIHDPCHPLPPENCLVSLPCVTRQPPHHLEDLDDSSQEPSPITLPPSPATLSCMQFAAVFCLVGEGNKPFIILRWGHGFDSGAAFCFPLEPEMVNFVADASTRSSATSFPVFDAEWLNNGHQHSFVAILCKSIQYYAIVGSALCTSWAGKVRECNGRV